MLVFELEGVAASGWGRRGWGRGGRGGERLGLRGLRRVGSAGGCGNGGDLIGRHVLHFRGGSLRAFESIWIEDGLPLLGRFVDGELSCCCDRTGVIGCHRHPSHHHLGPCSSAVLLIESRLHCDAFRSGDGVKRQGGGCLRVRTALLESTRPVAARAQVGGWA